MLRRTFLGLLPLGLFPSRLVTSTMIENILTHKPPEPSKPVLILQIKDRQRTEGLEFDWDFVKEAFKDFQVLIIPNVECSIVGEKQSYFNWQTMHLPCADLYSKETGEQIQERAVWVETKSGLIGVMNERFQMEVYQYSGELEVRFK